METLKIILITAILFSAMLTLGFSKALSQAEALQVIQSVQGAK
jgi:hypothetical protein